jgi:hypothetical protein
MCMSVMSMNCNNNSVLGAHGVLYGMCSIKRLGVANFVREMERRQWIVEDTLPSISPSTQLQLRTLDLDTTQRFFFCRRRDIPSLVNTTPVTPSPITAPTINTPSGESTSPAPII